MLDKMKKVFISKFGSDGDILNFFSPGRVNLIGEHIDYNGGYVFPCALTIGTYGLFRKRQDKKVLCYSMNFEDLGVIEFDLEDFKYDPKHDWVNYVKGVIWAFSQKYPCIQNGFEFLCFGNIPNGSGLSSSASLELLISTILIEEFNINIDMVQASILSQLAENKFIGVNCGIMDQFAIALGKADSAILLNTETLDYRYVPVNLNNFKIVIANTNKERKLSESKYNERRSECETALKFLNKENSFDNLADVTPDEFENIKHLIEDENCLKRATHVVYENDRTKRAVLELEKDNLEQFGKLLTESHNSLRDLYEVTGVELDTLVEISLKQEGVLGSRMTGAGFGGCTITLVDEKHISNFIENVSNTYREKIGYDASFYIVEIGSGSRKL